MGYSVSQRGSQGLIRGAGRIRMCASLRLYSALIRGIIAVGEGHRHSAKPMPFLCCSCCVYLVIARACYAVCAPYGRWSKIQRPFLFARRIIPVVMEIKKYTTMFYTMPARRMNLTRNKLL